ncbi:hypothetical protein Sjap_020686 [Stephania japonica]|uniref:Uncharacterized protein n=1 Tax=Stephania japonica TaxID=461633 RepID=A0AAP0F3X5_9MAGN
MHQYTKIKIIPNGGVCRHSDMVGIAGLTSRWQRATEEKQSERSRSRDREIELESWRRRSKNTANYKTLIVTPHQAPPSTSFTPLVCKAPPHWNVQTAHRGGAATGPPGLEVFGDPTKPWLGSHSPPEWSTTVRRAQTFGLTTNKSSKIICKHHSCSQLPDNSGPPSPPSPLTSTAIIGPLNFDETGGGRSTTVTRDEVISYLPPSRMFRSPSFSVLVLVLPSCTSPPPVLTVTTATLHGTGIPDGHRSR